MALALDDTTGTVNVSLAAAPSSGQVLIASSGTTATWGAAGAAVTAVGTLLDATGSVTIGAATAPGASGSVLVSSAAGTAVWSSTLGTCGSASFATNAGTATTSGFATNSGTATLASALQDATSTVSVSGATAPGAAGSVLVSSSATTAIWSTTTGTAGSATAATTAGFATNAGTATLANALGNSAPGTVSTGGQAAPVAAGSILTITQVSAGGTLASWSTTAGTTGSAGIATGAGTATALATGITLPDYIAPAVGALSMAATIAVNAAVANDFRLTLTSSTATMGNPSNPVDGQRICYQLTQDTTGGRTIAAWGTSYDFGVAGTPVLSTATSTIDIVGFIYNSAKTKWLCVGTVLGF